MATLSTMDLVGLGSLYGGITITIFNKAMTGGARNGAARLAWLLVGTAFGLYAYGAVGGMFHALFTGDVVASHRDGGSVSFYRSEYPLLFLIAFLGLSVGTGMIIALCLMCFWEVLKKG